MDYVVKALQQNPELAIFITLAVGFLIGRIKVGSFSLGTVVGTLLAGVIIGQLDIKVPAVVKSVFFLLFLFTTGYKVGPQFLAQIYPGNRGRLLQARAYFQRALQIQPNLLVAREWLARVDERLESR